LGRAPWGIESPGSTSESDMVNGFTEEVKLSVLSWHYFFFLVFGFCTREIRQVPGKKSSTRKFRESRSYCVLSNLHDIQQLRNLPQVLTQRIYRSRGRMSDQEDTGATSSPPERIVIGLSFGNSNSSIAFTSKVSSRGHTRDCDTPDNTVSSLFCSCC
jgi:hypothetical protein